MEVNCTEASPSVCIPWFVHEKSLWLEGGLYHKTFLRQLWTYVDL